MRGKIRTARTRIVLIASLSSSVKPMMAVVCACRYREGMREGIKRREGDTGGVVLGMGERKESRGNGMGDEVGGVCCLFYAGDCSRDWRPVDADTEKERFL